MQIRFAQLTEVLALSQSIRQRSEGASLSTEKMFLASRTFSKGVLHVDSICALVERYKVKRELDYAGICTLARALIETHNVLLYLTEAGISKSELELRLYLMHFNQNMDLMQIDAALGVTDNDSHSSMQAGSRAFVLRTLHSNQVFIDFDEKQRNHLLKGKSPYLMNRYKGHRPVPPKIESAAYNLFSHNAHTFGLATTMGGSSTPAGSMNVLILAVEMAIIYLSHMIKRYQAVRAKAVGKLTPSEKLLIDEALSLNYFNAWVEKLKRERMFFDG